LSASCQIRSAFWVQVVRNESFMDVEMKLKVQRRKVEFCHN
jgi:hypothetical protein